MPKNHAHKQNRHLPPSTMTDLKRTSISRCIFWPQIAWCSQEQPKSGLRIPTTDTETPTAVSPMFLCLWWVLCFELVQDFQRNVRRKDCTEGPTGGLQDIAMEIVNAMQWIKSFYRLLYDYHGDFISGVHIIAISSFTNRTYLPTKNVHGTQQCTAQGIQEYGIQEASMIENWPQGMYPQ